MFIGLLGLLTACGPPAEPAVEPRSVGMGRVDGALSTELVAWHDERKAVHAALRRAVAPEDCAAVVLFEFGRSPEEPHV